MKKSPKDKNQKTVALYDPYLDVMGGGERHILSILKVLEDEGYSVTIFWGEDLTDEIFNILNIRFKTLKFESNIFVDTKHLDRLKRLEKVDLFFYVTDGSYFISSAKKNFVFCMVPNRELYRMGVINKIKTINFKFITNSIFTYKNLLKWGLRPYVIYPPISDNFTSLEMDDNQKKEKMILVVGRFFKHLHAKRQDVAIKWFKELKKKHTEFESFSLHLVGSQKKEDESYLLELQKLIGNDTQIFIHANLAFEKLLNLYNKSMFYWHFTGYGIDEVVEPEKTEHLGITPLEAMAAGCITFAYEAGGPKELIEDSVNGFLFKDKNDLFAKMLSVIFNKNLQKKIESIGKAYIQDNFSPEIFKGRVKEIILNQK